MRPAILGCSAALVLASVAHARSKSNELRVNVATAASIGTETARNPHNYTLMFDLSGTFNGGANMDGNFSVSACPQTACFHLSGLLKIMPSPYEGFFPIVGMACALHFENVPRRGMDSPDWRITLVSKDQGGKGCASLPAGLAGVYKFVEPVDRRSLPRG